MSNRPNVSTASFTAASQSVEEVTSAWMATDLPRFGWEEIISTVLFAHSRLRSRQTTSAPSSASIIAMARPLPIPSPKHPLPVTIAHLPASERDGGLDGMVVSLIIVVVSCSICGDGWGEEKGAKYSWEDGCVFLRSRFVPDYSEISCIKKIYPMRYYLP